MPRSPIRHLFVCVLLIPSAFGFAASVNPHVDPSLNPGSCRSCHAGHGQSGSPMLPSAQRELCFNCHGSPARIQGMVARGLLSGSARPTQLDITFDLPYAHPITIEAFSRREMGAVTCTSCHAPHRGNPQALESAEPTGERRLSPRNPSRFEFELCQDCHGSGGASTQDLTDISRLLVPENRSFHPVQAPTVDSSPSVIPSLAGREINCTDCHGNSNPGGPRGPHGSVVPFMLRANYTTVDGAQERPSSYALCYKCHRRQIVLDSPVFPEHGKHIVDEESSCATCHNPHGAVTNRALIRFGEEVFVAGVSPSVKTGRLEFISDGPGSGACYLTCHGEDHSPEAYGSMKLMLELGVDTPRTRAPRGRVSPTRRRP